NLAELVRDFREPRLAVYRELEYQRQKWGARISRNRCRAPADSGKRARRGKARLDEESRGPQLAALRGRADRSGSAHLPCPLRNQRQRGSNERHHRGGSASIELSLGE